MYVLPAVPAARIAPAGNLWPATTRESGRDTIDLDLGVPRIVRSIAFPLRWHFRELDPRIAIQGSTDGIVWSPLWEDWTGGPALAAALQDPLEVPVRITIPDVSVRYLRIHPVGSWMRREVMVYGPKSPAHLSLSVMISVCDLRRLRGRKPRLNNPYAFIASVDSDSCASFHRADAVWPGAPRFDPRRSAGSRVERLVKR